MLTECSLRRCVVSSGEVENLLDRIQAGKDLKGLLWQFFGESLSYMPEKQMLMLIDIQLDKMRVELAKLRGE